MKSRYNPQLKQHYKDMKILVSQLKASGLIAAQALKLAEQKGLKEIAEHIIKAGIELNTAYKIISPDVKLLVEE